MGDGVLLGAGATVLGSVKIGDGSQVGAGTLVISDLPAHCVAVGGKNIPDDDSSCGMSYNLVSNGLTFASLFSQSPQELLETLSTSTRTQA